MTRLFELCAIILSLTSVSLTSDDIVLFTNDKDYKLQAEYEKIIETSKTLKLQFYEDCLNENCTKKLESNQNHLKYFSESEKQECKNYEQVAQSMNDVLKFCVDMKNSSWYGGAETTYQYWPLNKLNWTETPYVTKESDSEAVLESYFFNSDGFYIHIDDSVALFVDINGPRPGYMCFTAKVTGPYRKTKNTMQFRICKYSNPREAHENAIRDVFGMPLSIPDPYMVKYPIWSTWARYKVNVSTSKVKSYAREIVKYGFPRGTIEIDDNWETCYGSVEFNTLRFENIRELVSDLKSIGFKTSLWTHPFINLNCYKHDIANSKGYFVNSTRNTVNSTWWNGQASYIDFTNPEAATWWSNALHELLEKTGIDTLKFDAGESSWNPQLPIFYDKDLTYYPDNIVNAYLKTLMSFGNGIEYRSSRRSHEYGRFLRMIDRESRWDFHLGLPTLITSLLHLNMIGYPFVLPDMIGGNGYKTLPSKEMYIRWMQANTFMPVVQFSYTPWDFDQQTINICKRFMDLRNNYTDTIIQLMRSSVVKGSPVNPPVWWIDPTDPVAQIIDDEFLLGEDILVAPVITENAVSRDIYLPTGLWRDENNPGSPLLSGRSWLKNYPANLEVLPWFTKVTAEKHDFVGIPNLVNE
ncbi:Glycoside hydrolase family 31,Glycoside hydrolase superfamily [Cinara cedri]|uniref:Glycoside hydrolase family 31,Glycoside hydrolase superfamily n=1 Tax=Cinara cedri TaxID=506608 RepID=A0A5E4MM56_9HEMI|nr:Glycoside hydrolase family 31,Glycoside hydrolase superfamily [Cinara cedri]